MRDRVRITKTLEYGWCVVWPQYGFGRSHVEPLGSFRACIAATSQHKVVDSHNGGIITADQWELRDVYIGTRKRTQRL